MYLTNIMMGRKASFLWRTLNWLSFLRRAPVVVDEGLSGKGMRSSGLDRGTDKVCSQTRKLDARANLARHSHIPVFHSLIRFSPIITLTSFHKRTASKGNRNLALSNSWHTNSAVPPLNRWHTFALNWVRTSEPCGVSYTRSHITRPNPWTRA